MHLGNLSLGIKGEAFRLLPIYDMCSMGYSPHSNGETSLYSYTPPELSSGHEDHAVIALKMARDFWHRVVNDDRSSEKLRSYLAKGNPLEQKKQLLNKYKQDKSVAIEEIEEMNNEIKQHIKNNTQ